MILLIEDDRAICELYSLILAKTGHEIICAYDGVMGYELAEKHQPTVILLDLMLPYMSGQETLKKVRSTDWGTKIPVVILTNIGASEVPKDIIDDHVLDVLVKVELSPDELLAKVGKHLN